MLHALDHYKLQGHDGGVRVAAMVVQEHHANGSSMTDLQLASKGRQWRLQKAIAGGSAAGKYAQHKRRRNDTERHCREAGLQYRPVIHESQGGTSKQADVAIRAIAGAVAVNEHRSTLSVRAEMQFRTATLFGRWTSHAVCQRRCTVARQPSTWAVLSHLRMGPLDEA